MGRHMPSSCHAEPCHPLTVQCRDTTAAARAQGHTRNQELGQRLKQKQHSSSSKLTLGCGDVLVTSLPPPHPLWLQDGAGRCCLFVPSLHSLELEVDEALVGFA